MSYPYATPIVAAGSAFERGKALAQAAGEVGSGLGARIRASAEPAEEDRDWIDAQWRMQQRYLPGTCELIEGMAEGLGITTAQLFRRHVNYAVEDRRRAAAQPEAEECSAFAIRTDTGVLVAKNRDNPPELKPMQTLVLQSDPTWGGRRTLAISSVGSSPAASSGINSDGLCMADTSVRTSSVGLGALRYYLMDAVLYRCGTVAEAIDFIRSMPHVGGGNMVFADAHGHIAFVQLGHEKVVVDQDPEQGWLACTNHFLDPELASRLVQQPGGAQRENSESRLAYIRTRLLGGVSGWTARDCMSVLSSRGENGFAAICRETPEVLTLSGVIFDPDRVEMIQSNGRPSEGQWRRTDLR